jgi:oligogalacturonide transport system substrate-binding protein
MKNFLKVIGILCSVSLLFTLFAGCGAKNPSESAGSPATSLTEPASAEGTTPLPNENITLRFSWWGGDARHEATLEALKLYTQKFPNVKVEGEYSGWDGYVQKLSTQIAGGSAPDIISIPDIEAYNLIKQGTLLDLSDNRLVDTTVFDKNLFSKVTVNNKIYGVPLNISLDFCAIINADFFEKYGIPIDTVWDYDNLLEIGKRIHQQDNKVYLLNTTTDCLMKIGQYYIMQKNGKQMVTSDFTVNFTKEDYAEILSILKTFIDEGVTQSIAETVLFEGKAFDNPKWINGEIGMTFDCNTTIPTYRKENLKNLTVANMAVKKDAKDPFLGSSTNMFLGINAKSPQQEEAGKFVNWFFNDKDAVLKLQEVRGTQPTEAGRKILSDAGIGDKLVTESVRLAAEVGGSTPLLWVGGDEIRKTEADIYQRVLLGKEKPETAAETYLKKIEGIYAELRAEAAK